MGKQNSKSSSDERIREESRSPRPAVVVKIQLNHSISEFLKFYETNINQLMDLAEKLEKCQAERRRSVGKAKKGDMALSLFGGAGLVLDGLAGGVPLASGLVSVVGVGVKAIGRMTASKSLKKLKSFWEAYKGIIKVLKLKMQDVVRGIDTHTDQRNVQDTVLFEVLKLRARVTDAISTLDECQRDSESENCKMVRQYRDQVELFKPTMERFS